MDTVPADPERLEAPEPSDVREAERRFGRFTLCFELASGGMGNVYLARADGPEGYQRLVAVKRIHRHLAKEPKFVEMFLDEARIASKISHPNVCPVFDFGEEDGTYFIAMEYLVGETLSRVFKAASDRRDELPDHVPVMCRIVADAAEGLHAAHELVDRHGESLAVVHRDVSPQNLFVTYDGSVRLVDFGIARARDRAHESTTGTVKGKYAYMAPEQARGRPVDRRADVWSLGVLLWEGLTLRRLFHRENQTESLLAVLNDEVPPPSSVRPELPKALDAIALRALSRDIDARYPTARALGKAVLEVQNQLNTPVGLAHLSEWMDQAFPGGRARKRQLVRIASSPKSVPPVHTTPTGGPTVEARPTNEEASEVRPVAPRRRWPWIAGIALAAGTAIAAGAGITWIAYGGASGRPADDVPEATAEPEASVDPAPVPEPPAPEPQDPVEEGDPPAAEEETAPTAAAEEIAPTEMAAAEAQGPPEEPERRERPPVSTAPGTLVVITTGGWALVSAGGRSYGESPVRITLPPGRRVIEVQPFGEGPPRRIPVTVRPGETRRVTVPLQR